MKTNQRKVTHKKDMCKHNKQRAARKRTSRKIREQMFPNKSTKCNKGTHGKITTNNNKYKRKHLSATP